MPMAEVNAYRYTNRLARLIYDSFWEVIGPAGIQSLIRNAGYPQCMNDIPPPTLERAVSFAQMSALTQALEVMYGRTAVRGVLLRTGRVGFTLGLQQYQHLLPLHALSKLPLSESTKLRTLLYAIMHVVNRLSDHAGKLTEQEIVWVYEWHACAHCLDRPQPAPTAYYMQGVFEEAAAWVSNGKRYDVAQTTCMAQGAASCQFTISKQPLDQG
jgi:hypothetical protein